MTIKATVVLPELVSESPSDAGAAVALVPVVLRRSPTPSLPVPVADAPAASDSSPLFPLPPLAGSFAPFAPGSLAAVLVCAGVAAPAVVPGVAVVV